MRIHHACGCLGSFNELLGVAFVLLGVVDDSDSARDVLLLDAGPSDSNGGAPDSSGGAPGGKLFDSSLTETSGGGGALDFCGTETASLITDEVDVVEWISSGGAETSSDEPDAMLNRRLAQACFAQTQRAARGRGGYHPRLAREKP